MANDKTIIRTRKNRENPYVMIDKTGIEDERLSLKAKGLLATLLSKPDNWKIYITQLATTCKDGVDSVKAALKELREFGYVTMERIRDEKGKMSHTEWIVYEQPIYEEKIELKPRRVKKKPEPKKPIVSRAESISGFSTNGETTDGESHTTNKVLLLNNDLTNNELNNNKKNVNSTQPLFSKTKSVGSNDKSSVVVVSERLKSFLAEKKIKVNKATLNKWLQMADEVTVIKAIEYTLNKDGVKTVTGYVTRILGAGFTEDIATGRKDRLPEWIAQQEVAATTEELSLEQKKQAEELLRALGEIH